MTRTSGLFSRLRILLLALLALSLFACAPKDVPGPTPPSPEPPVKPVQPVKPEPLPPGVGQWAPLIQRLEQRGFPRATLVAWFSSPQLVYDPDPMRRKLAELLRVHYNRERNRKIQGALEAMGFDPGPVDGLAGDKTRTAIEAYQQVKGVAQNGEPDDDLLDLLLADLSRPRELWPRPPAGFVPPPEAPVTQAVYKSVLTQKQLAASTAFYRQHYALLQEMERRYGVPPELAVGIFTVETRLGEFLGGRKAFATLASMALSKNFEVIRPYLQGMPTDSDEEAFLRQKADERGDWAFEELAALLRYAQEQGHDPLRIPGSVYGAIGLGQFMPSNAVNYGVDGDLDGRVDLFLLEDAVMSFGNFMRAMGWQGDMRDPAKQRTALLRYNRSNRYVNTVLAVAEHVRRQGS